MYELARDVYRRAPSSEIRAAGLWKEERIIQSPQGRRQHRRAWAGAEVLNFCANNYLGLSVHPGLLAAARAALDARGFGLSSVRFICGTQDLHKELERRLAAFFGIEDTILYSSCFDANGGPLRDAARRGGRHHLRRAQPRLDHRRHPPLQGASATATRTATWPSSKRSCGEAADASGSG